MKKRAAARVSVGVTQCVLRGVVTCVLITHEMWVCRVVSGL